MAIRFIKNIWAMWTQLAQKDVWMFADAGAPTNGTSGTGAGFAGPGSLYFNTTTGKAYINSNTKASPTWGIVTSA